MEKLHHYIDAIRKEFRALSLRRAGMSPKRDWYALLASSAVLGSALVGVGLFQYLTSDRMLRAIGASDSSIVKLPDAEALAEAIGTYRERAMIFETLRTTPQQAPKVGAGARAGDGVAEDTVNEGEGQVPPVEDSSPVRAD